MTDQMPAFLREFSATGMTASSRTQFNTQAMILAGFDGLTLPTWVARRLGEGLAGVCLFQQNVESLNQLRELTDQIYAANPHAIIAIDEEGGDVTRLHHHRGAPFPGNAVLGRLADLQHTAQVGEQVGFDLRDVGIGLALAPVADVNSNPANPVIGVRSFGSDADTVASHVGAWVRAIQSTGVAACAKHFPGHGDSSEDSHLALPVVDIPEQVLRGRELLPFRTAIAAGVRTIMTSHILVPALDPKYPATLSERILQGLLREELRFDGVIVSDALDMAGVSANRGIPQAAALAVAAGCDLLCIGALTTDEEVGQIAHTIASGIGGPRLTEQRVADAIGRVQGLGRALAAERERRGSQPQVSRPDLPLTADAIVRAFAVTPTAEELIRQHREGRPLVWLQLDVSAHAAIAATAWGPFAPGGIEPAASVRAWENPSVLKDAIAPGAIPVVVGRDNHRHPWVCDIIDALRADGDTLVVDMGWPSEDFRYADVATFGASRQVSDALVEWMG